MQENAWMEYRQSAIFSWCLLSITKHNQFATAQHKQGGTVSELLRFKQAYKRLGNWPVGKCKSALQYKIVDHDWMREKGKVPFKR